MVDNVIPFIGGEEEKSEKEPLKVWGKVEGDQIVSTETPLITTQCLRVPVSDGHTAAVFVSFDQKPSKEEILNAWKEFAGVPQELELPHAPKQFIHYFEEDNRPQAKVDRNLEGGMAVSVGRLREDTCSTTSLFASLITPCVVLQAVRFCWQNCWLQRAILTK